VEGARFRTSKYDCREYCIQVAQDAGRGDAENLKTFLRKQCVSRHITPGLIAAIMALPVNLNY